VLVKSSNEVEVEGSGPIEHLGSVKIRSERAAKLFSIVTEKLYSDPVRAITREMLTNMVDAWLQQTNILGQPPPPGVVSLPDFGSLEIVFRDYGPGLSRAEIELYVGHILESSKDESNDFHGGWGLGLKCPFAYTKSWTIESRHGGLLTKYATFMESSGVPSIAQIGDPMATEEPTGLTISIPVKSDDIDDFTAWTKWYLQYLPNGSIECSDLQYGDSALSYSDDYRGTVEIDGLSIDWRERLTHGASIPSSQSNRKSQIRARILLGSIPYSPPDEDIGERQPIDLSFPIGSLQVTPDRDRLVADAEQSRFIERTLRAAIAQRTQIILESLKGMTSFEILQLMDSVGSYQIICTGLFGSPSPWNENYDLSELSNGLSGTIESGRHTPPVLRITVPFDSIAPLVSLKGIGAFDPQLHYFEVRALYRETHRVSNVMSTLATSFFEPDELSIGSIGSSQFNLSLRSNFHGIYFDDLGPGSIGRFRHLSISSPEYIDHSVRPGDWSRTPKETALLLCVREKATDAKTIPFEVTDPIGLAKLFQGIPADSIRRISLLDEPPERTTATYQTTSSTGSASINFQKLELPEQLISSPLVRKIRKMSYGSHFCADSLVADDLDAPKALFIPTNRGSTENSMWPKTTAAQLNTENPDWEKIMKRETHILDAITDNWALNIIFLPKKYLKEAHSKGWLNFFAVYHQELLKSTYRKFPHLQYTYIMAKNYDYRGTRSQAHQWAQSTYKIATTLGVALHPLFLQQYRRINAYVPLSEILPGLTNLFYYTHYDSQPHGPLRNTLDALLGARPGQQEPDFEANGARYAMRTERLKSLFPMLPTIERLPSSLQEIPTESAANYLRSITTPFLRNLRLP
jgi:hypothetical protein